jgi:hypothetical protein
MRYELADYESDQAMSSGRGALPQACSQLPLPSSNKKAPDNAGAEA